MISQVRVVRFKRFADQTFDLSGSPILLAGPNNSGKTTLLHAISAWTLALKRWLAERGDTGGKRRISVVLDEFTALPLREMNLLWLNRHTARRVTGKKEPRSAPIYIEVTVEHGERVQESLTIEFLYANEKLLYIRPVQSPDHPDEVASLPDFARKLQVVHVPAFSGIGTQEPRHTPGIQNKFVGEGRPGEIVRNLLLELWEESTRSRNGSKPLWTELSDHIKRLFQCELLAPEFSDARPYIMCEYRPKPRHDDGAKRPPKLDIANAGSGFHQIILLLAFFYARPASVLLLDEPDAHLHFILQREIFDLLRNVAARRHCKLIIATHAEVLLEGSEPEEIISFIGPSPRRLVQPAEKTKLRDALRQLTSLDLLQADHVKAVLYVEDDSDHKLLREWATILDHKALKFLQFPYVVAIQGTGNLDEAKKHFQSLRMAQPAIKGVCVLDRDASVAGPVGGAPRGLAIRKWQRYEIENYLLNPSALKRFVAAGKGLFGQNDERVIETEFGRNFPAGVNYLDDIAALRDLKASDFIVNTLAKTSSALPTRDLYMLASQMEKEEIHGDVIAMLDQVAEIIPALVPNVEANIAPDDGPEAVEEEPGSTAVGEEEGLRD